MKGTSRPGDLCPASRPQIVLIDGNRLTDLMIDYNIGVTAVQTYVVKRLDSDYFPEE
jgi:restriction system protein